MNLFATPPPLPISLLDLRKELDEAAGKWKDKGADPRRLDEALLKAHAVKPSEYAWRPVPGAATEMYRRLRAMAVSEGEFAYLFSTIADILFSTPAGEKGDKILSRCILDRDTRSIRWEAA